MKEESPELSNDQVTETKSKLVLSGLISLNSKVTTDVNQSLDSQQLQNIKDSSMVEGPG